MKAKVSLEYDKRGWGMVYSSVFSSSFFITLIPGRYNARRGRSSEWGSKVKKEADSMVTSLISPLSSGSPSQWVTIAVAVLAWLEWRMAARGKNGAKPAPQPDSPGIGPGVPASVSAPRQRFSLIHTDSFRLGG